MKREDSERRAKEKREDSKRKYILQVSRGNEQVGRFRVKLAEFMMLSSTETFT